MYKFDDLKYLMARLRDPDTGCPWDLKQSYETIVPYTIEETYEVVDAIERKDFDNLREELGDLMFQSFFYAQIADEESLFDINDVIHGIVEKLIRRHPHVFPHGTLESRREPHQSVDELQVGATWDAIKASEKPLEEASYLDGVPRALPALARAEKLQKKASKVGFDWGEVAPVIDKVREELDEVVEAIDDGDSDSIEAEVGDVLFAAINLARLAGVNPEQALRRSNEKFVTRFSFIEAALKEQGRSLHEASLQEMDELWNEAKGRKANNPLKR